MRRILVFFLAFTVIVAIATPVFKDVPKNHWAYEAVAELSNLKILTGYPDGTFKGNNYVTRYQLAVALYRLLKYVVQTAPSAPSTSGVGEDKLRAFEVKLRNVQTLVYDIKAQLAELERKLEKPATAGKYEELLAAYGNLRESVMDNIKKISELEGRVEALESMEFKIKAIEERLGSFVTEDELQKALKDVRVKTVIVASPVETEKIDVEKLKTDIIATTRESILKEVTKLIEEKQRDFERNFETNIKPKLKGEIMGEVNVLKSTLNEGISTVKTKVSKVEEEVSSLASDVSNLKSDVDELRGRVEDVQASVEDLREKLGSFEGEISQVKVSVKKLSDRLTEESSGTSAKINEIENELQSLKGIPIWGTLLIVLTLLNSGAVVYLLFFKGS